jgi:hypothetical protein
MDRMTAKFTLTFFDAGTCEERSVTLPLMHGDPSAGLLSGLDRADQQQVERRFRDFVRAISEARVPPPPRRLQSVREPNEEVKS